MSQRLRIYDGSTDPSEFANEFRIQAVYQEWEEANQLLHLPLFLKGKAKRMYDSITTKTAIDNVLKELIAKCAKPKEAILYKFYGRKFKPGESITDYACELKEFLDEASPGLTIDQQLPFLRAQLCMQVPEHMRALIQFNSSLSWDDLLSALDKSFPHVAASVRPFRSLQLHFIRRVIHLVIR